MASSLNTEIAPKANLRVVSVTQPLNGQIKPALCPKVAGSVFTEIPVVTIQHSMVTRLKAMKLKGNVIIG